MQVYSSDAHNDHNGDTQGDFDDNHNLHAGATGQPVTALLTDLKRRGREQ